MSKPKFRIGDKVRIIGNQHKSSVVGKIGTIQRIKQWSGWAYTIHMDDGELNCRPYSYEGKTYSDYGYWTEEHYLVRLNAHKRIK